LYADGVRSPSRLAAQTVLWHVLNHLVRLIAPVLVHTADEAWAAMRQQGLLGEGESAPAVHLARWLTPPKEWLDEELAQTWDRLFVLREDVQKMLEDARNRKMIGHSYEADVIIRVRGRQAALLAPHLNQLAPFFVVSSVRLEEASAAGPELSVRVAPAAGKKCERCWRVLPGVGLNADQPGLCGRCADVLAPPAPAAAKKGQA
jgi:isoleucyl-tRNA synthetase